MKKVLFQNRLALLRATGISARALILALILAPMGVMAQKYNPGDIEAVNKIIADNGWNKTPYTDPTYNSDPPWSGVYWSADATNKRITHLFLFPLTPKLTGTLDVTALTGMVKLDCQSNSLSGINVSGLTNLTELQCNDNPSISAIDVSTCTSLVAFGCMANSISVLDVSMLTGLKHLYCSHNSLSALDVSMLTSLEQLICENNSLSALDVSALTNMEFLTCQNNSLSALDVSAMASLWHLNCSNNSLTSLVLNASAPYTKINVSGNNMTSESAVTGKEIVWDGSNFIYSPQNVPQTPTSYPVTVVGGTGSGSYAAGATVNISADAPAAGMEFDRWTMSDRIMLANANSPSTSFTMPAYAVTATATYRVSPPKIESHPENQTVVEGGKVSFSVAATFSGTPGYMWQVSVNEGAAWGDITADGVYSGNRTATLTLSDVPLSFDGNLYRCVVVNRVGLSGAEAYSNAAKLAVNPAAAPTYAVTVSGGTGAGSYEAGATVSITADAPAAGKAFDRWTTSSNGVTFADATAAATSFTMPPNAVAVTATYKDLPADATTYVVTVSGGTGNGSYEAGATVSITADAAPSGKVFDCWTTASAGVTFANATAASTTFTMPSNAVAVAATYKDAVANEAIQADGLRAYAENGVLHVGGLAAGQTWCVYTITGVQIYRGVAGGGNNETLPLSVRGVHIVTDGRTAVKVVH